MKIFLIKTLIVIFAAFVLFQVTIGSQINKVKTQINSIKDPAQREAFKEKIKEEMQKGVEKENYFTEEERTLFSKFIKKILKELELIDSNK
tara:strand:+ start:1623 stop:1895 length:273 start_codon:yes stop_codon:yes gene_type:complete